jgi:hypothetical protein
MTLRYTPWTYTGGGLITGKDGKQVAYLAGRMNAGYADAAGLVMAAAPEMYQALEKALCDGWDAVAAAREVLIPRAECPNWVFHARAALAKARGEAG